MPADDKQIPEEFKSVEEVQAFWDGHSAVDYWNDAEDVGMDLTPGLRSKLESKRLYRMLELSPRQIAEIESRAVDKKTDGKHLIRQWVLEHM